jgi:NADH:ubiquinone oxidoreductase subunit 3 (subunit A)
MVGRRTSFKSKHSVDGQLTYACGEKTTPQRLTINISLYKYLTYFVAIDSSVLLLAFASSGLYGGNALLLAIYISIVATASFMLVKGRDH